MLADGDLADPLQSEELLHVQVGFTIRHVVQPKHFADSDVSVQELFPTAGSRWRDIQNGNWCACAVLFLCAIEDFGHDFIFRPSLRAELKSKLDAADEVGDDA